MKNIKKYLIALVLILSSAVAVVACGFTPPSMGSVKATDDVIGNGGIAVQKGEYVYFANGYTKQEDVKSSKDNKYNEVKYSALYRVKLVENKLEYVGEDPYVVENAELIAPRIAGTENTGIYIFGDKLYYTSPNTEKDKTGKLRSDLLDFYVANLNGANSRRIYTTPAFGENATYNMIKIGNEVYINLYTGSELYTINVRTGTAKKVATDVSSVFFYNQQNLSGNTSVNLEESYTYIYYTRKKTDAEGTTGNVLAKAKIGTTTESIIQNSGGTYQVKEVVGSNVFYTKTTTLNSNTCIFRTTYTGGAETQLTDIGYSQVFVVSFDGTTFNGLLVSDGSSIFKIDPPTGTAIPNAVQIFGNTNTILAYMNGTFIYTKNEDDKKLYKNNINNQGETTITGEDVTASMLTKNGIDFDGRNLYFFREYTSKKETTKSYLNRVDTYTTNTEGQLQCQFIGKFLCDDIPASED